MDWEFLVYLHAIFKPFCCPLSTSFFLVTLQNSQHCLEHNFSTLSHASFSLVPHLFSPISLQLISEGPKTLKISPCQKFGDFYYNDGTSPDGQHRNQIDYILCSKRWRSSMLLLLSRFSHVRLCATPQTAAHQAPLPMGLSRQEHWSGLPLPSPMHESEK